MPNLTNRLSRPSHPRARCPQPLARSRARPSSRERRVESPGCLRTPGLLAVMAQNRVMLSCYRSPPRLDRTAITAASAVASSSPAATWPAKRTRSDHVGFRPRSGPRRAATRAHIAISAGSTVWSRRWRSVGMDHDRYLSSSALHPVGLQGPHSPADEHGPQSRRPPSWKIRSPQRMIVSLIELSRSGSARFKSSVAPLFTTPPVRGQHEERPAILRSSRATERGRCPPLPTRRYSPAHRGRPRRSRG
jgi:hypothetical protein